MAFEVRVAWVLATYDPHEQSSRLSSVYTVSPRLTPERNVGTLPNDAGQRIVHDAEALNTGTLPTIAPNHFLTPVDHFFTRSHAAIPTIDARDWRLEVGGLVDRLRQFSLNDLEALPQRQLTATLVCAGLRRAELLSLAPMPGELPWGPEPASTGVWTGVMLADVLRAVGVSERARHVEFVGLDQVERHGHHFGFGGSIDLEKALNGDVLLATELNGAPLPPVHGYPMRVVVPGWIGARSVKWLGRITLQEEPSDNYFQSRAYRVQREINPSDPRDVSAGIALSGVPLNAVILEPAPDQAVAAGQVRIRGWAMGSAGQALTKVEVSPNEGRDWIPAQTLVEGTAWSWTFWEATALLPPGRHTLIARAVDRSGAMQPSSLQDTWNVRGYANNAWHRVEVEVR